MDAIASSSYRSVTTPFKSTDELSIQERAQVERMKLTDREVRIQEQVHMAQAAGYVRVGPVYRYEIGPDGKKYVAGGRVSVDGSAPATPEEAIRKARTIASAAVAPANPSLQDLLAAQEAYKYVNEARRVLAERRAAPSFTESGDVNAEISAKFEKYLTAPLKPYLLAWA